MQGAADELDAGFYREAAFAAFGHVQFTLTHMYQFAPEAAAQYLGGVLPGGVAGVPPAVILQTGMGMDAVILADEHGPVFLRGVILGAVFIPQLVFAWIVLPEPLGRFHVKFQLHTAVAGKLGERIQFLGRRWSAVVRDEAFHSRADGAVVPLLAGVV